MGMPYMMARGKFLCERSVFTVRRCNSFTLAHCWPRLQTRVEPNTRNNLPVWIYELLSDVIQIVPVGEGL